MSDKAYSRVKSSKLMFKGASKPKKVTKRQPDEAEFAHRSTEDVVELEVEEEEEEQIRILSGSGRITSSGTTIFGHETRFSSELAVGDAIVVSHPQSLVDETKIVRMVLSNVSISVSSAFSCDLVSTAAFRYVKAPNPKKGQTTEASSSSSAGTEEEQRMRKLHQVDAEVEAFGTYASQGGTKLVYREKVAGAAGTYRIVTKQLTGAPVSREELLKMRSKKKSDRHCG